MRSSVLNYAIIDQAPMDPFLSTASIQFQIKESPKSKRRDIWQKILGFENHREYLDFRTSLYHLHSDNQAAMRDNIFLNGIDIKKCAIAQDLCIITIDIDLHSITLII